MCLSWRFLRDNNINKIDLNILMKVDFYIKNVNVTWVIFSDVQMVQRISAKYIKLNKFWFQFLKSTFKKSSLPINFMTSIWCINKLKYPLIRLMWQSIMKALSCGHIFRQTQLPQNSTKFFESRFLIFPTH